MYYKTSSDFQGYTLVTYDFSCRNITIASDRSYRLFVTYPYGTNGSQNYIFRGTTPNVNTFYSTTSSGTCYSDMISGSLDLSCTSFPIDLFYFYNDDIPNYAPQDPTSAITENSVDEVNQTVSVDVDVDVKSLDSGYYGRLEIIPYCTLDDNSKTLPSTIVKFNESWQKTNTTVLQEYYLYEGYDYGVSDSTHVKADNVKLRYSTGYNCTYKIATYLYNSQGNNILNPYTCNSYTGIYDLDDPVDNTGTSCTVVDPEDLEFIPSTSTSNFNIDTDTTTCSSDSGVFAFADVEYLACRIEQILTFLFIPKNGFIEGLNINELNYEIKQKAPFAYFYAVYNIDTSITPDSTSPTFIYPLYTYGSDVGATTTIINTDTNETLSTVKLAFNTVIWCFFIVYIIFYARRFYQ